MVRKRDWTKEIEGTGITYIGQEGNYVLCSKDGFTFKCYRTNWPPSRLTAEVCTEPTEYFKFQVRQIHGDTYGLENVVYTKADNMVSVVCPIHGDFEIRAASLKRGQGCAKCSHKKIGDLTRSDSEDFREKATLIHGNVLDYSKVKYTNANTSVTIICQKHGEFQQTPTNHLAGKGCPACGVERSKLSKVLSIDQVLQRFKEVHADKFDYSQMTYGGDAHEHLKIICREHGTFLQSYANHYHRKQGCPVCSKEYNPRLRSGFIKSAESKGGYASLYLINCFDEFENFHKIGITTKPVNYRFSGKSSMPYSYRVEDLIIGEASWIWDFETLLHKEYKEFKYIPEKEFGGMCECFKGITLDDYNKLINTVA